MFIVILLWHSSILWCMHLKLCESEQNKATLGKIK